MMMLFPTSQDSSLTLDTGYIGADNAWHPYSSAALTAVRRALEEGQAAGDKEEPEQELPVMVVTQEELCAADYTVTFSSTCTAWSLLQEDDSHHSITTTCHDSSQVTVHLPHELPIGYHRLLPQDSSTSTTTIGFIDLIVTPSCLSLPQENTQLWGLTSQVYALPSRDSWGIGDARDLARCCEWAAGYGADFLSINPIHAGSVTLPVHHSPYLPHSRRFFSLLMVAIPDVPEIAWLSPPAAQQLEEIAEHYADPSQWPDLLERDGIYQDKCRALRLIWEDTWASRMEDSSPSHSEECQTAQTEQSEQAARWQTFTDWCDQQGEALSDFSFWCAYAEEHGEDSRELLDPEHSPNSAWARQEQVRYASRALFFSWTQFLLHEQLVAAQERARRAGMSVGIIHDMAVGVHRYSADVWCLSDCIVPSVSVGAPPDYYNQQGQNWNQPPWHPQALRQQRYRPFIDIIRQLCSHGGGVRIDHILGLFRLWWIPEGHAAADGVYVPYPTHDLLRIIVLEATRAGAVVIGEDLGTVPPQVQSTLRDYGLWGTSVLWYEYTADSDHTQLRQPQEIRPLCMVTASTHDMPPAAAYLSGQEIPLRHQLGLLSHSEEEEWAEHHQRREDMISLASQCGVWPENSTPGDEDEIHALYRLLWRTPCRARAVALVDVVGSLSSQNIPGTDREYDNWCIPVRDRDNHRIFLDDLPLLRSWRRFCQEVIEKETL